MKILSEKQCSVLVSISDQVSARNENFTSFLPCVICTWVDTQRAHNLACMEFVPSHAVKL